MGLSLCVELMNFFVLVVCKWFSQGQDRLSPWPPRFPRPLGHPPQPTPVAGSGLAPFWQLLFWPAVGYLRPRAKTMVFHAQGGTRGVLVQKVAVLGPPTSTLDGPIGGLVEHNIFRDIFQKVH